MTVYACTDEIASAVDTIRRYVSQITGSEPSESEIASALTRYFVLKEICEHIQMLRHHPDA